MFGFLKEKLKSAIKKFTGAVEEKKEEIELPKAEDFVKEEHKKTESIQKEKKILAEENKQRITVQERQKEKSKEEGLRCEEKKIKEAKEKEETAETKGEIEEKKETTGEKTKEKTGFFAKLREAISTTRISEAKFDELFWELEVALLENNVAFEVIEKIKADLKQKIVNVPIKRGNIEQTVVDALKESINELLQFETPDILKEIREKKEKPYVIVFLGANGSGKTTTIAKMAYLFQKNGLKCVLAAGDTWRSAAIQQLEEHAQKLNIPIVKHDYGADPAAVAFDGISMAKARNFDVVLVDTAGRQHSNTNLMDEMRKIVRVAKPDLKIYIGEMIAGNDCIEQIKTFDEAVNIDGAVLTKADIDEKGGTAISLSYVTKKPIFYLCTGQNYEDMEKFEKEKILKNLF